MLRNAYLIKNLRYLSIYRCKLCQGTILPALTSYLNEDENLVRFSFVLNNQSKPIFEYLKDEDESTMNLKSQTFAKVQRADRFTTTIERQAQETGFQTDMEILHLLDAATLHPRLEVIQIVQVMQDYIEAVDYVNYKMKQSEHADNMNTMERMSNEHIEFREQQRQKKQRVMFNVDRERREEIYFSIYENLTISSMSDGLSCLRRLEIRYLPLDPLLVS